MVTVQDIGLQLTKPVKELSKWNFPFSQTLEKYCTLFNATCNKSFGEAGLILQNSAAVYVHRVDSLWNITENSRNLLVNNEQEEVTQNSTKKRDRKMDMCFQEFKTVNFAKEVDKNINIKKNITHMNTVKSKNRCFIQLEKGIAQHVSIDIYDINGEVIGKKYDFRCNQNISIDGVLVDALVEFAPQDFCCDSDNSISLSTPDCTIYNDNNQNANSDTESERNNDDSLEEEIPDLITSLESSQQNLSLSENASINNTLDGSKKIYPNMSDSTNSLITDINSTILWNNKDLDDNYLNNRESIDVSSVLDSPPESVNSKDRRTSSTDDLGLINDTNEDLSKINLATNIIQNTPPNSNIKSKIKSRSSRSTSKSIKRKFNQITKDEMLTPSKRGQIVKKNLAHILEESTPSQKDRPNMFKKNLSTCIKYIREYNSSEYNDVTNIDLDLLGFRLCVNVETNANISDNHITDTSINEVSSLRSSSPIDMSLPHENFCDIWLQSDSPHFSSKNVDKWHELMQPKLREAEQRSTFCIRDYASRIIETFKTNDQRRISFDAVIENEHDVARYFLALLDLASKQNVEINADKDLKHDIEIILCEEDRQSTINGQANSHD
ncbi:Condensin-2 complex subunit H2 C-terminal domain-containing protein [Camponotus japonicus]